MYCVTYQTVKYLFPQTDCEFFERGDYDLHVPDFGSVLSKHLQGSAWMNTQVGARAGFLEGLTFELGLEDA